jgi:hypothetical protein
MKLRVVLINDIESIVSPVSFPGPFPVDPEASDGRMLVLIIRALKN